MIQTRMIFQKIDGGITNMLFDKYADSPKGFAILIIALIVFGIAYMFGANVLVEWATKKITENRKCK